MSIITTQNRRRSLTEKEKATIRENCTSKNPAELARLVNRSYAIVHSFLYSNKLSYLTRDGITSQPEEPNENIFNVNEGRETFWLL